MATHALSFNCSQDSPEASKGMAYRLVVKRTFLQVEIEQTPSSVGALSEAPCRARSEPCFVRDWSNIETDDESDLSCSEVSCCEGSCSEVSFEEAAHSPMNRDSQDFASVQDFVESTSLFVPSAYDNTNESLFQFDDGMHSQWYAARMVAGNGGSVADSVQNGMILVTPAQPYVLLLGMPCQSTCIGSAEQPSSRNSPPYLSMLGSNEPPMQQNGRLETRTTLMLRNIPNDYSRAMLLELLDSHGFAGRYDFVYLPMDFKRTAGLGYAFINCVSSADAVAMKKKLRGFMHWRVNSQKVCEVRWGEPLQGLEAHIERYRNSPVMHYSVPDEYKPIVFTNGIRSPFPAPTKRIRTPHGKASALTSSH